MTRVRAATHVAVKETKKFAKKMMGTEDVRVDSASISSGRTPVTRGEIRDSSQPVLMRCAGTCSKFGWSSCTCGAQNERLSQAQCDCRQHETRFQPTTNTDAPAPSAQPPDTTQPRRHLLQGSPDPALGYMGDIGFKLDAVSRATAKPASCHGQTC